MGNFPNHMKSIKHYSWILAGSFGVLVFWWGGNLPDSILVALGALVAIHIGASFPDFDHHSSIPFRRLKATVRVGVWTATLLVLGYIVAVLISIIGEIVIESANGSHLMIGQLGYPVGMFIALVLIGGYYVSKELVSKAEAAVDNLRPKHRGPTHRPKVGFLVSIILGFAIFLLLYPFASDELAIGMGLTIGITHHFGFLDHLELDGIIS